MIKSKKDLKKYMEMDRQALGIHGNKRPRIFLDYIYKFEVILRKHEYYHNVKGKLGHCFLEKYYSVRHQRLGAFLGFDIPINVFGPGLRINHYGYIVVNEMAKIGSWCDIHQGVNIGQNITGGAPQIGDNVWIGPGAKIFGEIQVADRVAIGANAVVNRSVIEEDVTVAGIPAAIKKETGNPWVKNLNSSISRRSDNRAEE
ncbi:MAG TPA: serine acetyltransferase [Candidatus Mediterraneibacter faecavium]|uniref:Serine acetyltransferase n=1 Tax=Candidatus Mediterraneibacter faecavium TaxID=2838668 RepID=A0A9D2QBD5_9FIRM|nr:serine acetyltransferase [Candidatus Mediterraneibacter faecavium]